MVAATCTPEVQANLLEAKQAYHLLMTGQAVAEVTDQNGDRVRYTTANISKLANYITQLKLLCPENTGSSPAHVSGPLGFYF